MNRSFSAPNRAAMFPTAQAMQAPLGHPGGPSPAPAAPAAAAGLARADAILRRYGQRDLVDPEIEPLDPDINDPDPLYEIEPEDPSHDSSLARQGGDEEDEEEPTAEDEPAASAHPQGRQDGEDDEEDDEEMQAAKDIDIIIIDVDEEHEHEPEPEEMPA